MSLFGELDDLALGGGYLMLASLVVILYQVRERWSSSLGLLFVGALILFHGICEINLLLFPIGLGYRYQGGMDFDWAGYTLLVAGLGIFSFAIAYCLARPHPKIGHGGVAGDSPSWRSYQWVLDLNPVVLILWMCCGALYRIGGNHLVEGMGPITYILSALLFYAINPVMILMALWLSAQHSVGSLRTRTYAAGLLLMLAVFTVLGGNRTETFTTALSTFILLHKFGIKTVTRNGFLMALCMILAAFFLLTALRVAIGRADLMNSSPAERIELVIDGLGNALSIDRWQDSLCELSMDLGYRFDGNLFLCNVVLYQSANTSDSWDLEPIKVSIEQVVPSFIWSGKDGRTTKNVKDYMIETLHLPKIDYLQTPLAEFYACGGLMPMIIGMMAAGLGVGYIERVITLGFERSFTDPTQPTLLLGLVTVCFASGLSFVESGFQNWLLAARNALILWVIMRSTTMSIFSVGHLARSRR